MTNEQLKRIKTSKDETLTMLERAKSYMENHQDKKLIAFCEAHLIKLDAMLNQ